MPLFDRALAVTDGDPALADLRLLLQLNQAAALGDLDRYDAAIVAAEQVRQRADDAGNVVRLAQAQSVLGELLFDVGRWDDALAEVDLDSGGSKNPVSSVATTASPPRSACTAGTPRQAQHIADAERYAARLPGRVIVRSRLPGAWTGSGSTRRPKPWPYCWTGCRTRRSRPS